MLKHVTDEVTGEGAERDQRPTGGFFSSLLVFTTTDGGKVDGGILTIEAGQEDVTLTCSTVGGCLGLRHP